MGQPPPLAQGLAIGRAFFTCQVCKAAQPAFLWCYLCHPWRPPGAQACRARPAQHRFAPVRFCSLTRKAVPPPFFRCLVLSNAQLDTPLSRLSMNPSSCLPGHLDSYTSSRTCCHVCPPSFCRVFSATSGHAPPWQNLRRHAQREPGGPRRRVPGNALPLPGASILQGLAPGCRPAGQRASAFLGRGRAINRVLRARWHPVGPRSRSYRNRDAPLPPPGKPKRIAAAHARLRLRSRLSPC